MAAVVIPAATETTRQFGFRPDATSFRVSRIMFGFTAKITRSASFADEELAVESDSKAVTWITWLAEIASALAWDLVVTRIFPGLVPLARSPLRMALPIEPVPRIAICIVSIV
jgi:hypothetical protein